MEPFKNRGLYIINAATEDCDLDSNTRFVKNADYLAEISGELPCDNVKEYIGDGNIPLSPFLKAADNVDDIRQVVSRLSDFSRDMLNWKMRKSTAFQLLNDGSIEYIATALSNKMGSYLYECDNDLKTLQCLQEAVLEGTKHLFIETNQDQVISGLISELASINKEQLHQLAEEMDGIDGIILAYRKIVEVFSNFMDIYPNLLPAETYHLYKDGENPKLGIATCSFSDIKTFYQDAYESIMALIYIPVCLDNIKIRGDYQNFPASLNYTFQQKNYRYMENDFKRYKSLDNGMKLSKFIDDEPFRGMVAMPANSVLRNGIGHNNIRYDGVNQKISAFDRKNHNVVKLEIKLIDMAIECLGLVKSAVMMSEILLFILRFEFGTNNIHSIIHPRFYKNSDRNDKCPCGSNKKFKKCCLNEIQEILSEKG